MYVHVYLVTCLWSAVMRLFVSSREFDLVKRIWRKVDTRTAADLVRQPVAVESSILVDTCNAVQRMHCYYVCMHTELHCVARTGLTLLESNSKCVEAHGSTHKKQCVRFAQGSLKLAFICMRLARLALVPSV